MGTPDGGKQSARVAGSCASFLGPPSGPTESRRNVITDYEKGWDKASWRRSYNQRPEVQARTRAVANERIQRCKNVIAQAKALPCADCGNSYPVCVMDFDHVRGEKQFTIASFTGKPLTDRKLSLLLEEIAKCDVVCANCHRLREEAKRG